MVVDVNARALWRRVDHTWLGDGRLFFAFLFGCGLFFACFGCCFGGFSPLASDFFVTQRDFVFVFGFGGHAQVPGDASADENRQEDREGNEQRFTRRAVFFDRGGDVGWARQIRDGLAAWDVGGLSCGTRDVRMGMRIVGWDAGAICRHEIFEHLFGALVALGRIFIDGFFYDRD